MATILKRVARGPDGKPLRDASGQPLAWRDKQGRPRWFAQVAVGRHPATGRSQFVSKTFLREGDAKKWARAQEGDKDGGTPPATTRESFAEYLTRWLPIYAGTVRDSTSYNIRKTVEKWIIDPPKGIRPIGGKQLRKLVVSDFDRLYRSMHEYGMRARGIEYLHGILKRALKAAVKKGELPRNPAEYAERPKADHKAEIATADDENDEGRVEALDREQAGRFLDAARQDHHAALWFVLLTTGLRPGEALALKWRHVDLTKGELHVRATLSRLGVDRKEHPRGWKLTKPKTERSRRTVPLPDITIRELRAWKKQQTIERLAAGSEWQDEEFVFTTQTGGPLSLSNVARRSFRAVMERAKLGSSGPEPEKPAGQPGPKRKRPFYPAVRVYALRHTFATLLLLDGTPLIVVSRLLGHKTIKLTADTYSHVLRELKHEAIETFDRMFVVA